MITEELFNESVKVKFLSQYPKNSQATYRTAFEKTRGFETDLKKDIYNFSYEEFVKLFQETPMTYVSTLRSFGRIITKYVEWAIQHGYSQFSESPLRDIKTEWFDQFLRIEAEAKILFWERDITIIEYFSKNAQDSVIPRLVFEGVQGEACSEVRNLKVSDINFDNKVLTLTDADMSQRELEVSQVCINLLQKAISQKVYWKSNGKMNEHPNVRPYTDLVESDYVIRNSNTGKGDKEGPVNKYVIMRRIAGIAESIKAKNFNVKNISKSGMLYAAYCMREESGDKQLGYLDILEIKQRFKVNNIHTVRTLVMKHLPKLYGGEV